MSKMGVDSEGRRQREGRLFRFLAVAVHPLLMAHRCYDIRLVKLDPVSADFSLSKEDVRNLQRKSPQGKTVIKRAQHLNIKRLRTGS